MLWSRTYKFSKLEDLVRAVKDVNPHVRVWNTDKLTLRITENDPDKEALDAVYAEYGAEPATEWEDKYV